MRIGLVTEGKSEWFVFEEVITSLLGANVTFTRFRPDLTLASGSPFGWRGVKHWCVENRDRLGALLLGVKGQEIDVLIIHVDCSMAHNEGARRPCPPANATADALRIVVLQQWLNGVIPPIPTIVVAASQTIDTWIAPILAPPFVPPGHIECSDEVENELVRRRLLRRKDDQVKKPESTFRPLARLVAQKFEHVVLTCTQAHRFKLDLLAAAGG